jgi:hypothetical protein
MWAMALRHGPKLIAGAISRLLCSSGGTIVELNGCAGRRERKIQ